MKNLLSLFAAILLFFSNSFAQFTVLDYYKLMPADFLDGEKYEIELKNGKWTTRSDADYEIAATVDLKNGFLSIQDHGTGGGTRTQEVAVFMKADKTPLIGVTNTFSETLTESRIAFYEYKNKQWKEVTRAVFPEVAYNEFLPENYDMNKVEKLREVAIFNMVYQLPQFGTTVKLTPGYSLREGDPVSEKKVQQFYEKDLKYRIVEMNWNRITGKFEKGKKLIK